MVVGFSRSMRLGLELEGCEGGDFAQQSARCFVRLYPPGLCKPWQLLPVTSGRCPREGTAKYLWSATAGVLLLLCAPDVADLGLFGCEICFFPWSQGGGRTNEEETEDIWKILQRLF